MLLGGKARCPLLCAVLLGVVAGAWTVADGSRDASATAGAGAAAGTIHVMQSNPPVTPKPLPLGRHMEAVSDVLSEAAAIAPGTELLVGPGRLDCQRDNICILHDEDDPGTFLVLDIASLRNGQHDYLIDNPSLAANPVAVRLLRIAHGETAYQALQVIDARTRETIGLQ